MNAKNHASDLFLFDNSNGDWKVRSMDAYMHERQNAQNAFSMPYQSAVNPEENRWSICAKVFSQQDFDFRLSEPW